MKRNCRFDAARHVHRAEDSEKDQADRSEPWGVLVGKCHDHGLVWRAACLKGEHACIASDDEEYGEKTEDLDHKRGQHDAYPFDL